MLRYASILVAVLLTLCLCSDLAFAQSSWPEYPLGAGREHGINRGPGGYFSLIKLGLIVLLYLGWTKTTDWVNIDCQLLGLPYSVWNFVVFAPFVVGLLLVVTIPAFPVGYGLLFLAYLVPLIIYIVKRNSAVEMHERVLTPSHLRYLAANQMKSMGVDIASEKKAAHEKGAPVDFEARGGTDQENQANIIWARQSGGYLPAKDLVAEMVNQRADKAMLDYSRDAVAVRYQIDGVFHEADNQDRETGDEILAVLKRMANLNVQERRKRQSGRFEATYEKRTYKALLISQGTQTGERVILQLDRPQEEFGSLRELGMREKMEKRLTEILSENNGMVILSAPPTNGISTTLPLMTKLLDRYLRDVVAFQNATAREPLAENIDLFSFDPRKDEKPQKVLETLIRRDPNVIIVDELNDATIVQMLCNQAIVDKVIISTIRAKEGVEALLRVLLLKVPASTFAPAVKAVVNQRLIRTLCPECKQSYEPSPQLLQKLGIPAGRIDHLYRPPEPSDQDKVCQHCNGIGYYGRVAIFELVVVDKRIRQALEKQPKLDVLRQVSRQAGNRNLQQEGVVLVAQGQTSVQELSRVLKQ